VPAGADVHNHHVANLLHIPTKENKESTIILSKEEQAFVKAI